MRWSSTNFSPSVSQGALLAMKKQKAQEEGGGVLQVGERAINSKEQASATRVDGFRLHAKSVRLALPESGARWCARRPIVARIVETHKRGPG